MTELLREWFGIASADAIVIFVTAGLVVFFWCGHRGTISKQIAPALMTSLGIFGTFWGIFNALAAFATRDGLLPQNITESIAGLLSGMSTAFVTSLLGLGAAILTKFIWSLPKETAKPEQSPEQKQILDHLDAIKRAIAGDDDASLVTQIQKLRDENRDGFKKMDGLAEAIRDALVGNLQKLMDDLREIIAERLGDQLEQLIIRIEDALVKKFGETFVQFNEAVQALKQWQEDYRSEVERLTIAFDQSAQGISKIREDCETIPATMENLRVVMDAAVIHTENLTTKLEAFAAMKEQAEQSFPTIKENLDRIGNDLAASAQGLNQMEETIRDAFVASKQETENIVKQHTAEVGQMVGNMRETMEQAQRDIADKIDGTVQEASRKFAAAMNSEIDRITKEWGEKMVGIAERCAETMRAVNQLNDNQK